MSNVNQLATYTKEFKLQAVQLAEKNGSILKTAKKLGISDKSRCKWIKELKADGLDAFRGKGNLTAEYERNRQLEREVKRLKEINDILKKATKFFAGESK